MIYITGECLENNSFGSVYSVFDFMDFDLRDIEANGIDQYWMEWMEIAP